MIGCCLYYYCCCSPAAHGTSAGKTKEARNAEMAADPRRRKTNEHQADVDIPQKC
jgi:hypothetical protein